MLTLDPALEQPVFLAAFDPLEAETKHRFDQAGFTFVRNFVPDPLRSVAYRYLLLRRQTGRGRSRDAAVPGAMSLYADLLMESILDLARPAVEQITSKQLWPTYAYCRLYQTGDQLHRHRDRRACEISATITLGSDLRKVRQDQPDYAWPIYMNGIPVTCDPGDMVVYKGCEIEHWRETFEGEVQAQLFLHYVDRQQADAELFRFDGRPMLGLPSQTSTPPDLLRDVPADRRGQLLRLKLEAFQVKSARSGANDAD